MVVSPFTCWVEQTRGRERQCISKCLNKLCRGVTRATAHPVFIHWIGLHKGHWAPTQIHLSPFTRLTQARSCLFLSQKEHFVFSAPSRASAPNHRLIPSTILLPHASGHPQLSLKRTLMSIKACNQSEQVEAVLLCCSRNWAQNCSFAYSWRQGVFKTFRNHGPSNMMTALQE